MFQSYEEDFGRILNSLQKKIAQAPSQGPEMRQTAIAEGGKDLLEAEKCVSPSQLRQMEIELSMMPPAARPALSSQVRHYREDFERTKQNFRKEESRFSDQKSRETLMGARLENVKPR
jgi:vesicle transport through interaction with t-SNAREs 1